MPGQRCLNASLLGVFLLLMAALAQAAVGVTNKIPDVRGTKHNLSAAADNATTPSGGTVPVRAIKASSETQVCVFCHTPHGATSGIVAPLWNRQLASQTYIPYTSSSIEATDLAQPGGSSKLCLSCHDGTMAIDKVNVLNGAQNPTIEMKVGGVVTPGAKMPAGSGVTTGFTRNLGINLTNDHPISFTYDSTLATADGELRTPATENTAGGIVMNRAAGMAKPVLPLENNQMQCATCHDPHIRDKNEASNGNAKFLRLNRFQVTTPAGATFDPTNDIICLACHDKAGSAWAFSAHANQNVASQTYASVTATTLREIPSGTPVWQVACLNCHDTHTVQGARRLLREGTGTGLTGGIQDGLPTTTSANFSKSAIEQTCYQCHDSAATMIGPLTKVPAIKNDFDLAYRMPINAVDQGPTSATAATLEVHDIGTAGAGSGKDFVESQANLGLGALGNRHAECTDCHNPHRVIKAQNGLPGTLASGNTNDAGGTHKHDGTNYIHTNAISGVLRGAWGVEPIYPNASFASMPNAFTVKRGDPGSRLLAAADTANNVTREYQICLKCHSNYGYGDNNVYPSDTTSPLTGRPAIVSGLGRTSPADVTAIGHTNFTTYTNQAKEFQATHTGGGARTDSGAAAAYTGGSNINHRSFHPVMGPTGRTAAVRGGLSANNWTAPWSNTGALGVQTMYCSDCHGSKVTLEGTVRPDGNGTAAAPTEDGKPWGPHGSSNPFLLKGLYNINTGSGQEADGLCFKCHQSAIYANGNNTRTGFWIPNNSSSNNDGHKIHKDKIGKMRCNWCHVAVPHGWKNKAFLVNLNDLGPEVGLTAGTAAPAGVYTNGPYYRRAYLRVRTFKASGNWDVSDCMGGTKDSMITACGNPP